MPNTQEPEALNSPSEVLKDFLSALFAGTQDPIRLVFGDTTADVVDKLDDVLDQAGAEPVYLSAVTKTGQVPFLYSFTENAVEDEWRDLIGVKPTVVLFKDGMMITAFALELPGTADDPAVVALAASMGGDLADPLADPIPTPGANGWRMIHCDESIYTAFTDLEAAYGVEPAIAQAEARDALNDAALLTSFSLDDPRYAQEMIISTGGNRESKNWIKKPMPVAQFVALLSSHREDNKKDGLAFVLADILGAERKKAAVAACYGVGLDIDVGVPGAVIDEALVKLGCLAVRYTTHSHGKASTKLLKDRITRWAAKNGLGDVDQDVIVRFLREESRWDESIIASVEYAGDVQEPEGFMVDVNHTPMPKHRVVLPLATPFEPTKVAKTHDEGMKMWGQVCYALARLLGDLPLDRSAVDPSRLFYFPRHAPKRPHETTIVGGDLLDWKALDLDGAGPTAEPGSFEALLEAEVKTTEKAKPQSKSTTAAGKRLGRWSIKAAGGFQIVDVIKDHCDDRIRTNGAHKIDIECPFDEEHSDPGNPEDKGCFAVNAGDGSSDIFTIKCQHDSCSGRTNLDHLGKMIADGWFTREDIDEDAYNTLDETVPVNAATKAGAVVVKGVLSGIEAFDPKRCLFDGPNAEDEAIEALGKVASVVSLGNKVRIATRTKDGLTFNVKSDAALWFSSYRALLEVGEDKAGNPKVKEFPALDLLLKSDKVKRYAGIDCDPSGSLPDHMLNTWEGIKIAPAPGDCSLLLKHLKESTCAGNEEHYRVLIKFFAHMFQKPNEKPGFAPVVIGPRGAGKSTVADFLRRAIGRRHSTKISQGKHLVGNFNAHLSGRLFVQAEEVTFGGDKRGEGPLKDAITSTSTLTEPKGFDPYEETSFSRFFLVTNPGHAVPAGDGERRWFVLKVRDLFEGKELDDPDRLAYFDALRGEADNGGIAAFLHYLVNDVDISDFKPWAPPKTEALGDQARQSLSDEDRWVLDVLEHGAFNDRDGFPVGTQDWELDEPLEIERGQVQSSFNSYVRSYNGSSGGAGAARRALKAHGDIIDSRQGSGERKKTYRLGPRREWRDRFVAKFGIVLDGGEDA